MWVFDNLIIVRSNCRCRATGDDVSRTDRIRSERLSGSDREVFILHTTITSQAAGSTSQQMLLYHTRKLQVMSNITFKSVFRSSFSKNMSKNICSRRSWVSLWQMFFCICSYRNCMSKYNFCSLFSYRCFSKGTKFRQKKKQSIINHVELSS